MDLNALELFAQVAQVGSFANVARNRQLDPSYVSRTIATLEKEMGVRLFQRTTRKIALTEAGRMFLAQTAPPLEEIRHASLAALDASSQPRGTLRVTASNSFGLTRIVPLLPSFAQAYPELMVDLQLSDQVLDLVAERIDVAVRLGVLPDSSLVAHPLLSTRYLVVASPDYLRKAGKPGTPADVSHHPGLLFPLQGFRTRWLFRSRHGKVTEVAVSPRITISNALALQLCAKQGMGVALLPSWLVEEDVAAGSLENLFPEYDVTATDFKTGVWCVYPSRAYVPTKVRAFIKHLQRAFAEQGG